MNTPTLIGLTGYAQSGKNTVAEMIQESYPKYRILAFADGVRAVAELINPVVFYEKGLSSSPVTYNEVINTHGYEVAKAYFPGVRDALVYIGAGLRETIHPDIWIDRLVHQLDTNPAPTIITDVRYPNEADAILELGGVVWLVNRGLDPANEEEGRTIPDVRVNHAISNRGSLVDLQKAVTDAIYRTEAARQKTLFKWDVS